ncbi:reverse transcriptase [Corchorus capsularis]|uniref:Reverse transcriptase n=1 Tax=Corchorus capsularis TaxID=210143 RepID=A0A1R3G7A1_COCAP|nr:reverse transcriptase [Corchorus capsularis]
MESTPPASPLVTDLADEAIRRSKKKYKKRRAEEGPVDGLDKGEEELDAEIPAPKVPLESSNVSYRDRGTRSVPVQESTWEDWTEIDGGDDSIMFEDSVSDGEEGEDSDSWVRFSIEEKRELRKPWNNALIVKLLGKILGFKALSSRVQQLWRIEGKYRIIDLGNDYFCFKFQKRKDCKHVLDGGPWVISGHYLTVRQWTHNFKPNSDVIKSIVAWIRLPQLPLEYYTNMAIRRIASKVGRVIRLDKTAESVVRGGFARVCVELDLSVPLRSSVDIGTMVQAIEYEGLHLICFSCGQFGHRRDACSMTSGKSTTNAASSVPSHSDQTPSQVVETSTNASFDPWMIAQQRGRRPVQETVEKGKSTVRSDPGHDSRNRFNHFKNVKEDLVEKKKEKLVEEFSSVKNGPFKYDRKEWKPKKDYGINISSKSSGKEGFKAKSKGVASSSRSDADLPKAYSVFEPNKVIGPPPGFSFKAGDYRPVTFDAKRLEELVGSKLHGPVMDGVMEISTASFTTRSSTNEGASVVAMEFSKSDGGKKLTSDPSILPPQNPPSNESGVPAVSLEEKEVEGNEERLNGTDGFVVEASEEQMMIDVNTEVVKRVAKYLRFSDYFEVPTEGMAGGIVLFWNAATTDLTVHSFSTQIIHTSILYKGVQHMVSFAYVRPQTQFKDIFWRDLKDFSASISSSWIVLGDFNDFAALEERWDGKDDVSFLINRVLKFRNRWNDCNLLDAGSSGSKFTWRRRVGGRVVLQEKLDRVLWNLAALTELTDAKIMNLPCLCSDHHPILLDFNCIQKAPLKNRPVRFEAAWLTHPEFSQVFAAAWSRGEGSLSQAIEEVTKDVQAWKVDVFRNIFHRKRVFGKDPRSSKFRGFCYFYFSPEVGNSVTRGVVYEQNVLSSHVVSFYSELFGKKEKESLSSSFNQFAMCVLEEEKLELVKHPSFDEVRLATFSMKGLKAPGVDGIQPIFYQRNWVTVKESLLKFVDEAITSGKIDVNLLHAHMVLIPKGSNPTSVKDFRPITLLNTCYKILSKVLVNRMRPILQRIIGPFQNSFLAGRSTTDNILITQEIVHTLSNLKGRKGAMILKIDLQKAYDNVSWEFLHEVLNFFGFPTQLISLIMFCVTNIDLSIIWNGDALPSFKPQQGLRQGDPLSPYLFILAMERLSHMILERVDRKQWVPVKSCRSDFGKASGLEMNLLKSKLWVSPNISRQQAGRLSSLCGIPLGQDLGTYLGVPIIHTKVTRSTYSYVIDRVLKKLANWKGKVLSYAGRRTLIQSSLSSIPVYTMQTALLLVSVCEKLDQVSRNFLWGGDVENSHNHLVNWDRVCRPKVRSRKGLTTEIGCSLCEGDVEIIDHILRGCPFAEGVWSSLYHRYGLDARSDQEFRVWIRRIVPSADSIVAYAVKLAQDSAMAWNAGFAKSLSAPRVVKWKPHIPGILILNMDGSRRAHDGQASAGGLIRDSNGGWVKGFMLNIGTTDSLSAELWGIRQGLLMAKSMNIASLVIEMDAAVVVQFLKDQLDSSHPCYTLVRDCYEIIQGGWITKIRHIYREGNRCADLLATLAHDNPPVVSWC